MTTLPNQTPAACRPIHLMHDTPACADPTDPTAQPWAIEAVTPATLREASLFVNASRRLLFPSLGWDSLLDDPQVLETSCVLVARAGNAPGAIQSVDPRPIVAAIAYIPFDYRFPHLPPPVGTLSSTNSSTSSLSAPVDRSEGLCKIVEVLRLFVVPQYRRHGLAASLFRSLKDHAVAYRAQYMYLHTHPFLPGAIRFWKMQGFDIICVDEEDEVWQTHHMQMQLGPIGSTHRQNTLNREG